MSGWIQACSTGAAVLTVAAMCLSLFVLLARYAAEPFASNLSFGALIRRLLDGRPLEATPVSDYSTANRQLRRRLRKNEWAFHNQLKIVKWVVCVAILSRLVIFASALVGSWLSGELASFFHDFRGHWVRWDCEGYLSLAENWYTLDNRKYLVLTPVYPLLIRLLSPVFLGNAALAGVVISNLALIGSGWALYLLVQEKQGQVIARRAVQLLMFCPLSVFFSVPYAESLFFFLTLLSVLLARRQQFAAAVCVGILAAGTRMAGVLTVVPVYLEILKYERSLHLWPRHKRRCVLRLAGGTLLAAMIGLGLAGYLLVNRQVTGSFTGFIDIQRSEWNQTFGNVANTLRYSIEMFFTDESTAWKLGVWAPQCLSIAAAIALLAAFCSRMDPGDGLYAWLYLTLTLASTWLLTGPRMLISMYPLYSMLAEATRRKGLYGVLLTIFLILLAACSYMYAVVGNML